ncbi:hypothetical protein ANCCAN_06396 [Ancylostoma caninum]|uniref:Peptidase M12A domain-containing protein n=1 Tax=Ancylostoma caninum TaxID=29170 RepID=A0A368GVX8_ANCCA|nr:hypothetical protein ANCCAN_06396 [Ancylostoma caninum]
MSNFGPFQDEASPLSSGLDDRSRDQYVEFGKGKSSGSIGEIRRKRQAYKGAKFSWRDGLNYKFDPSTSDQVKEDFTNAAKAWSQDTCVDIRLNSSGECNQTLFRCNPGTKDFTSQLYMMSVLPMSVEWEDGKTYTLENTVKVLVESHMNSDMP